MLNENKRFWVILTVVCAANLIAHALVYPHLPETIPVHWDSQGNINGWGARWTDLVLGALPLLLLVLFRVIPKIDPRYANYEKFGSVWRGFVLAMIVLMAAASWMTEGTVFGLIPTGRGIVGMIVGGGIGVLFIILGNYMPRIRQNYTFGIKTPWTLDNEHVWDRTHRMAGYVYVVSGILLVALGFFGARLGKGFAVGIIVVAAAGTLWLTLYSYLVYAGKMK